MKKGIIEKLKEDEASAVVEAVISFAGFLFVIFTILNVVNFCRAQMLNKRVDAIFLLLQDERFAEAFR